MKRHRKNSPRKPHSYSLHHDKHTHMQTHIHARIRTLCEYEYFNGFAYRHSHTDAERERERDSLTRCSRKNIDRSRLTHTLTHTSSIDLHSHLQADVCNHTEFFVRLKRRASRNNCRCRREQKQSSSSSGSIKREYNQIFFAIISYMCAIYAESRTASFRLIWWINCENMFRIVVRKRREEMCRMEEVK